MDVLVSVALDEVCASLSAGLPVTGLWTRLSGEFEAAGLPLGLSVKSILFARLIALPHISLMERKQGKPDDTLVHSAAKTVEAAERRGALLFASPDLRDKFLGIYDHRYSASKLSTKQKETLERVGASRTSGVTQKSLWESIGMETKESIGMEPNQSINMKPSKRICMKANNFHYVVKTLQSQGLIVGKQAIVKSNDVGGETEYGSRNSLIVSTNLLYLSRYAKELNMNSNQRIEIAMPKLGRDEEINIDVLHEDENLSVDYKNYVSIHDYLPAMKDICDKLEEASGKVLAVSDIKKDLSYKMPRGHRAWRNVGFLGIPCCIAYVLRTPGYY
ncbi:uncharacterized protein LOC8068584 [Sorghum bicolor]|uniref:uncharacterized protein LOC8068584 n=1 Tax=Sorghum bicolor TaxID=4558 RepID=UPI000B4253A0|nr:uncharacterized protein LOC8068584 [Sorghum bicolor]|eukprot:XP_021315256.1 uncharacterized protein LOC8068584 [Sorghum bicolor]